MDNFQNQLIVDLAKKYTYETFDFKNKSPQDLLKEYQETFNKISKVVEEQNSKTLTESIEFLGN